MAALLLSAGQYSPAQESWNLKKCIDYAIRNNIDIKMAESNAALQKAEVNTAKWARLPSLNGSAGQSWNWGRTQTAIKNEDTGNYNTMYVNTSSHGTNMSVNASIPLFTGFQISNRYGLAKLNLEAALADLDKARQDISIQVTSAFLQVLFNKELNSIAQGQADISKRQLERIARMEEVGKAAQAEVADAKARVAQAELNVVESFNNYQNAILTLCQLIEYPSPEDFVVDGETGNFELKVLMPAEEIYRSALKERGDIRAAELRLKGGKKNIRLAQSELYPQISLNAGLGTSYYSTINRTFSQQMRDNYSKYVGISLSVPIFNRFSTINRVKSAKIQYQQTSLQLERTKKNLYKEIQQARFNAANAESKYNSSHAAATASKEAFRLMSEKYENGKANAVEFNEARQNLMKAESDELQAKYEYIFRGKILDFYRGIPLE